MIFIRNFFNALLRRKKIDSTINLSETRLDRCLTTLDLTGLGIGSTLGLGIYVLAGDVASRTSGPAVTISFLIAAIASVFAGLCYAEFGARVPKAGSAYVYSYVTVGEFMAFVIGWNLVLEYVIGTASVARGYSNYIDALINGTVQTNLRYYMPMDVSGFSQYPDFLAFLITFTLTVMLVIGVKESTRFNSIFTCINLLVVAFVVIAGSFHLNFKNWNLSPEEIPESAGKGGFLPYGFSGMMSGAATCFYAFIGFDVIATTGEEAKNPQRSIPIGIVLSLLFVFLAYFGISAVQTLMLPYYLQTEEITKGAPLPYVFEQVGWPIAKWIISVGALTGLSTSLLGAMFPLPRVLYSMASDGVIFRSLAEINPRTRTPILATFISGIFAGAMAALFDVKELADMMSIGTLLAYTLVSVSVLILRFSNEYEDGNGNGNNGNNGDLLENDINRNYSVELKALNSTNSEAADEDGDINDGGGQRLSPPARRSFCTRLFNTDRLQFPTKETSNLSTKLVIILTIYLVIFDSLLAYLEDRLMNLELESLLIIFVMFSLLTLLMISLTVQPRSSKKLSFHVPWVPLIPVLSMFVNFYLMFKLSVSTWIRFGIWMTIGLAIYFFYGIWNSNERQRRKQYETRTIVDNNQTN